MSSVTSTQVKVDPLKGSSNYEAWKRVIEAVLICEDLWEIVASESKEPEQPNTATAVTTQDGRTVHDPVAL